MIKVLPVPKFNYCDVRKGFNLVPLVSDLLEEMSQYGNAIQVCPITPGFYSMKEFPVDRSPFVAFFPSGLYVMKVQFSDENRKRIDIGKIEIKVAKL
jgi:Protein of unknown function (DUF1091)